MKNSILYVVGFIDLLFNNRSVIKESELEYFLTVYTLTTPQIPVIFTFP